MERREESLTDSKSYEVQRKIAIGFDLAICAEENLVLPSFASLRNLSSSLKASVLLNAFVSSVLLWVRLKFNFARSTWIEARPWRRRRQRTRKI